jgi:hypothetical protein
LVSESSWCWHSFKLQSHSGTAFEVTELEMSSSHTGISVKESPSTVVIFREFLIIDGLVILAVIVKNVDSLFSEVFTDFRVFVKHISEISFLEIRVKGSVSESGIEQEPWEDGQELEAESNIGKHVKSEGNGRKSVKLEVIIHSMSSFPPHIQTWEVSQSDVLDPGMEQRSGELSVFGLLDMIVLIAVLWVSVVRVLPFILPTFVVGIVVVPGDLVSDGDVD